MVRRQLWRITIGIIVMAGGVLGQTNSPAPSGVILRQAYLSVVHAELARTANQKAEAVKAYTKALELYGRLQAEYPGWQGDAIGYRVAECQNALIKLDQEKTPDDEKPFAAPGGVDDTNAVVRLTGLIRELEAMREVLAADGAFSGGPTDGTAGRELERVRAERDEAERANQSLLRRLTRLETRAGRGHEDAFTNVTEKTVSAALRSEARRLMEAGDNVGALKLLREARVMIPGDADLCILLGVAACRAGLFDDAVVILKPFDTRDATQANALLTLGTAYMGLGRVGDARVAMEKALKIDARSPEANYNMAQILMAITPADPVGAQKYYRRAIELGLPADTDLENSLRMAVIISRIKNRPKSPSQASD